MFLLPADANATFRDPPCDDPLDLQWCVETGHIPPLPTSNALVVVLPPFNLETSLAPSFILPLPDLLSMDVVVIAIAVLLQTLTAEIA
ncbi:unnamed protein product [Hydatigera taeniaeformis]|uniref:Secreted protein n=1 Tax=Hydatigena taeniaeformis TaxID=6205 RepID=A0A0R3XA93_HYDTA|nr:unnamed protein product [Hydatigera taeniaeformis]